MAKEKPSKCKKKSAKQKGHKTRNIILVVVGILFIFGVAFGYWLYRTLLSPNVNTGEYKDAEIFIPTVSSLSSLAIARFLAGRSRMAMYREKI